MEFDDVIVKESPGVCRCCLSEGCYKDLGSEYLWMDETEVYADMLLECFDISVSQNSDGPNGVNRLICEVCITRLRDACNFKKQVLQCEKRFVDMVARGDFGSKVVCDEQNIKLDLNDAPLDGVDIEYIDDGMDFDDANHEPSEQDLNIAPVKAKARPGRPRKNAKVDKKSKEIKPSASKSVAKGPICPDLASKNQKSSITTTQRNRLIKKNAINILESSTVVPFKWHRHDYLCFFCHKTFKDIELLKEHTRADHENNKVKSAVMYLKRDERIKVDVSEISCRQCGERLNDLDHLVDHSKNKHNRVFFEDFAIGVIPYKFHENKFQCAICGDTFEYFIKLNQHMNTHYGNYVCELCGKSFLSQDRLRCHSLCHGTKFRCNLCAETFGSLSLKTKHESEKHNSDKTIKCFYCPEIFQNYGTRKRHHVTVHNIEVPIIKCPVCEKIFQIDSKMRMHVKEVHLREKNHSCTICDQRFFSRTHVQKHMVKHSGERIHECGVCKKAYARKQTLRDHMRIHSSERRFVCTVCSQGFVQNNSLRLHIKVHHPESNI